MAFINTYLGRRNKSWQKFQAQETEYDHDFEDGKVRHDIAGAGKERTEVQQLAESCSRQLDLVLDSYLAHVTTEKESDLRTKYAGQRRAIREHLARVGNNERGLAELKRLSKALDICSELETEIHGLEDDVQYADINRHEAMEGAVRQHKQQEIRSPLAWLRARKARKAKDAGGVVDAYVDSKNKGLYTHEELVGAFGLNPASLTDPEAFFKGAEATGRASKNEIKSYEERVRDLEKQRDKYKKAIRQISASCKAAGELQGMVFASAMAEIDESLAGNVSGVDVEHLHVRAFRIKKALELTGTENNELRARFAAEEAYRKQQQKWAVGRYIINLVMHQPKNVMSRYEQLTHEFRVHVFNNDIFGFQDPTGGPVINRVEDAAALAFVVLSDIKESTVKMPDGKGGTVAVWELGDQGLALNRLLHLCHGLAKKSNLDTKYDFNQARVDEYISSKVQKPDETKLLSQQSTGQPTNSIDIIQEDLIRQPLGTTRQDEEVNQERKEIKDSHQAVGELLPSAVRVLLNSIERNHGNIDQGVLDKVAGSDLYVELDHVLSAEFAEQVIAKWNTQNENIGINLQLWVDALRLNPQLVTMLAGLEKKFNFVNKFRVVSPTLLLLMRMSLEFRQVEAKKNNKEEEKKEVDGKKQEAEGREIADKIFTKQWQKFVDNIEDWEHIIEHGKTGLEEFYKITDIVWQCREWLKDGEKFEKNIQALGPDMIDNYRLSNLYTVVAEHYGGEAPETLAVQMIFRKLNVKLSLKKTVEMGSGKSAKPTALAEHEDAPDNAYILLLESFRAWEDVNFAPDSAELNLILSQCKNLTQSDLKETDLKSLSVDILEALKSQLFATYSVLSQQYATLDLEVRGRVGEIIGLFEKELLLIEKELLLKKQNLSKTELPVNFWEIMSPKKTDPGKDELTFANVEFKKRDGVAGRARRAWSKVVGFGKGVYNLFAETAEDNKFPGWLREGKKAIRGVLPELDEAIRSLGEANTNVLLDQWKSARINFLQTKMQDLYNLSSNLFTQHTQYNKAGYELVFAELIHLDVDFDGLYAQLQSMETVTGKTDDSRESGLKSLKQFQTKLVGILETQLATNT